MPTVRLEEERLYCHMERTLAVQAFADAASDAPLVLRPLVRNKSTQGGIAWQFLEPSCESRLSLREVTPGIRRSSVSDACCPL